MREARIIRIVSNLYTIEMDHVTHNAVAMGKLRLKEKPVVGDFVSVEEVDGKWVIQKVLPRKNSLVRPLVANIDQVIIVMSAKKPDFSYRLVDRLLFLVCQEMIDPVIVVSKMDLVDTAELLEITSEYRNAGYPVYTTSKFDEDLNLEALFRGKVSVLAGQSGVGKSSLMNRLDATLSLDTQEISDALGRGKHTTRHNQLYPLYGGWIADTPGFSSLDFSHVDPLHLAQNIHDFKGHIDQCRFRNCMHVNEPGCEVKRCVESGEISKRRYEHYCECLELIKEEN